MVLEIPVILHVAPINVRPVQYGTSRIQTEGGMPSTINGFHPIAPPPVRFSDPHPNLQLRADRGLIPRSVVKTIN